MNSGLAEDLPQESAQQGLQSGSHHLPLVDEQGNHFVAPLEDAQDYLSQGYQQPSPEQLGELLHHAKYSSTEEQLKTLGEGGAEAASFGASTGIEKMLGAKDEDIRGRKEVNPGVHAAGQGIGLVGSSLLIPGGGAAGALDVAGNAAARMLPQGTSLLAKAGRSAIKQAAELAMFQTGDEISKAIVKDPNQSGESALAEIGLAAAMGGAFGGAGKLVADPLWQATKGTKLAQMLSGVKSRVESAAEKQVSNDAMKAAGVELSPEMQGAMTGEGQRAGQVLQEADSRAGKAYRASREADEAKLDTAARDALGKGGEPGKIPSQAEAGQVVKDAFEADLENGVRPTLDEYDAVAKGMDKHTLPIEREVREVPGAPDPLTGAPGPATEQEIVSRPVHDEIAEGINQIGLEDGHFKSPSSQEMAQINRITKELPLQTSIGDLRNLRSKITSDLRANNAFNFAGKVGRVFDDAIEGAVERSLGEKAPELLARYKAVKGDYRSMKEMLEYLNDHLHVGNKGGAETFLDNFKSLEPEKVLARLKASKDAGLQQFLSERMPEVAQAIKGHQLDALMEKAGSYRSLSFIQGLRKELGKLTPEAKAFILPEGPATKLDAVMSLADKLPPSGNPSKTAGMMDSLNKHALGGIGSVISMATGHNPLIGGLLGEAGRFIGRELPDQGRLAMLKFLGTDAPVSAGGFRAMYEAVGKMHAADSKLTRAAKAIFQSSVDVGEDKLLPNSKHVEQLDHSLKAAQQNPEPLMNVAGDLGHYMPEHAAAMGAAVGRAAGYLNSLRPNTSAPGPLDPPRVPSRIEQAAYERQLGIANNPLLVLQHIKNATVLPQDIKTLQVIYPSLYNHMSQKLIEAAIDHKAKGQNIPYKTRLGLSAFAGMPLDSSIMPQNIMANQPLPSPTPQPSNSKAGHLNKLPGMDMSGPQSREAHKQGKA